MSSFRTELSVRESEFKISHSSNCLFVGSCFTENIGNHLQSLRFPACINPFGILYNPISIAESIRFLGEKKVFTEDDLIQNNELWCSFYHHGRFSDTDKARCLSKINESCSAAADFLTKTHFLFITFGSAFTYRHKEKNMIVANCHKFPASLFEKKLLDTETIVLEFKKLLTELVKINPGIKIIYTVSPVRHINDGITENQLSKSILHVAVHRIISETKNSFYFPAYELMMDDLRDYRFYGSDMIHPSDVAVDYVRKKFADAYIEKDSAIIMSEIEKLYAAKNHRTFHPDSAATKEFMHKNALRIKELKKKFPYLDLKEFDDYFGE